MSNYYNQKVLGFYTAAKYSEANYVAVQWYFYTINQAGQTRDNLWAADAVKRSSVERKAYHAKLHL